MRCVNITFSPTGGTKKVADALARGLADESVAVDLCDADADFSAVEVGEGDVALIALPCFGGRAPKVAIDRLRKIAGNGASCVVVSVYGDRAFDDALLETADAARELGFNVVAGVAAVAQHSIMPQYAVHRPNADDVAELEAFGRTVREAVAAGEPVAGDPIPGNRPYLKAGAVPLVPKYAGKCCRCGRCAANCPTRAISPETLVADKNACIACMRCVVKCPDDARKVNGMLVKAAAMAIKKQASTPKPNELYAG